MGIVPQWAKIMSPVTWFTDSPIEEFIFQGDQLDVTGRDMGIAIATACGAVSAVFALKSGGEYLGPILAEMLIEELAGTELIL